MSSYQKLTKNPTTGEVKLAWWLDDYFGQHHYGVMFSKEEIYEASKYEWQFPQPTMLEVIENPELKPDPNDNLEWFWGFWKSK